MTRAELLARICDDLDVIVAADAIPEGVEQMFVAPSWLWVSGSRTGSPSEDAVPLRRRWEPTQVTGEFGQRLKWTVDVMGVKEEGEVNSADLPVLTAEELRNAAKAARTDLILLMHPVAHHAVEQAESSFSASYQAKRVLSRETVDMLADEIVFGPEFNRIIERLTSPTAWRTDPLHWLNTDLGSHGTEVVRKALGDPREGRDIRALSNELGTRDVPRLIAAYSERWPKRRPVGHRLVTDALTWVADPMVEYQEHMT